MSQIAHPETICRRCGGPNVSWFAPSPLWNAVMRGGSIDGPQEFGELICPTCFCVLAEERGVACDWRLHARAVHVDLETTTPSGRKWDEVLDLWVESGDFEPGARWIYMTPSGQRRVYRLWRVDGDNLRMVALEPSGAPDATPRRSALERERPDWFYPERLDNQTAREVARDAY